MPQLRFALRKTGSSAAELTGSTGAGRTRELKADDACRQLGRSAPSDKIIFYLTEDELPQLMCVFLGLLPSVDFLNHGPQHNKSMKLEHQGKHLYLTMAEGSERKAAVQLDAGRSTRVATLVARAFQAVNDDIDWNAARDILTRLTAPMAKARAESAQARRP